MTLSELNDIDWDAPKSTAAWTKLLNDLLGISTETLSAEDRDLLADQLDAFADHSDSDDLSVIVQLDQVARRAARSLRRVSVEDRVTDLKEASNDYMGIVKSLDAQALLLRKETSILRAEKIHSVVVSLTDTIASVKAAAPHFGSDDPKLVSALEQVTSSARKLRDLLEKPV